MIWKKITLFEACQFMQNKQLLKSDCNSEIVFTDFTRVRCESVCNGPYSDDTPDLELKDPEFFIGEPNNPEDYEN